MGCDKCKVIIYFLKMKTIDFIIFLQVHVFCKRCITRNCGRSKFAEINEADEWACFTCQVIRIVDFLFLMFFFSRARSTRSAT